METTTSFIAGKTKPADVHPEILDWAVSTDAVSTNRMYGWEFLEQAIADMNSAIAPSESMEAILNKFYTSSETDFFYDWSQRVELRFDFPWFDDSHSNLCAIRGQRKNQPGPTHLFVDCNDFNFGKFRPSASMVLWMASGGIWLIPRHEPIGGRSRDADSIISSIKHAIESGWADPSKIIIGGTGENARIAARVAFSESLCTNLVLEEGIWENEPPDLLVDGFYSISESSPLNPALLQCPTLFINSKKTIKNTFGILHEIETRRNLLNFKQSENPMLDSWQALGFAMNQGGVKDFGFLGHLNPDA